MDGVDHLLRGGLGGHGGGYLADHVGDMLAVEVDAQDLPGLRFHDDLEQTVGVPFHQALAVGHHIETTDLQAVAVFLPGLGLSEADAGDLGIQIDAGGDAVVVHLFAVAADVGHRHHALVRGGVGQHDFCRHRSRR